eukprot:SM000222S06979  [mRNA]  locus=s222:118508:120854:+ [translate_table: standard]
MDADGFRSRMSDLNFGAVMAAAARDYQQDMLAAEQARPPSHDEVDLGDLLDDPELEKLHAERLAALKRETEKRQAMQRKGHGEYREVLEGDFLEEVTGSESVVCHFYHQGFLRCKVMDKHLSALATTYINTKFIKVDVENAPFFVTKLAIKVLPCVVLFKNGVAIDRVVGFDELGGKDDFATAALERRLSRQGCIVPLKKDEEEKERSARRSVRSTRTDESDSDSA